ncbi:phosphoethanolamine [Trichodelitschia bisporula]|uniref:ethanolamine-phosphate cytidylyltransferase n=1 Tax=Trichodelitschia bisporula TaxID=703511 RepID=A0A6G1HT15_9PEZI|nr:phosphoethanolamine [Trichodelitschia bisporula]
MRLTVLTHDIEAVPTPPPPPIILQSPYRSEANVMASLAKPDDWVPQPGEWPVDPQEDVPISDERIWVDGCFDFAHHGHAGAMLQARRLGNELLVGIHSDEAIREHKGPTVMTLDERVAAVSACRWATLPVPYAPYVTQLSWITHYGARYVVHGDDITSDSSGEDCYRFVKAAERFKVVKRTPGISTTDLVGRMLLYTKTHFIRSFEAVLDGKEGSGSDEERKVRGKEMKTRIAEYASDASGHNPWCEVCTWRANVDVDGGEISQMVAGRGPQPGQRVVYVDGGFDLFSSGHIEFLRRVVGTELERARTSGWYDEQATEKRKLETESDYEPVFVVAGVHDDEVINRHKGVNYPIMNIFERGLCVLQCKYINAVVFSAPFAPVASYLKALPHGIPDAVYHGPTDFMPTELDPYADARQLGIFCEIPHHPYSEINARQIVERILKNRSEFEARQRAKGFKAELEEKILQQEAEQATAI